MNRIDSHKEEIHKVLTELKNCNSKYRKRDLTRRYNRLCIELSQYISFQRKAKEIRGD